MTIEVGKLYSCSGHFLLLYPDKDTDPKRLRTVGGVTEDTASDAASYWTRELGKPVSYCNPETILLVLSVDKKYVEVLAGDRKVWIINEDWFELDKIR